MHKFVRGEEPVDLEAMRRRHPHWDAFARTAEHTQLGDALYERQARYCAYCETRITQKENGHIEHLERRSDNPARTFDWSNMFFSCNHRDSCGNYKDDTKPRLRFNPADIVDPSCEDPLDFFTYDALGGISARDEAHKMRAEETIRIFHLDKSARLCNIRANAARTAINFMEREPSEDEITAFLNSLPPDCDCISVYYSLCGRKIS